MGASVIERYSITYITRFYPYPYRTVGLPVMLPPRLPRPEVVHIDFYPLSAAPGDTYSKRRQDVFVNLYNFVAVHFRI